MNKLSLLLIITFCLHSLSAAENPMPKAVALAEARYAEQVQDILDDAQQDLNASKDRLVKVLKREIKNAERAGDKDLVNSLTKRVAALENKQAQQSDIADTARSDQEKAIATLFGEAQVQASEQRIPFLQDDLNIYKWKGGSPKSTDAGSFEGTHSFIPTGNNHTFLEEPLIIGTEPGQISKIKFHVYLQDENRAMIFQACINGGWKNRIALDGRAHYAGQFTYPHDHSMLNLKTKTWQQIEIDLIQQFGAKTGSKLNGLAFSSQETEAIIYDAVYFIVNE